MRAADLLPLLSNGSLFIFSTGRYFQIKNDARVDTGMCAESPVLNCSFEN